MYSSIRNLQMPTHYSNGIRAVNGVVPMNENRNKQHQKVSAKQFQLYTTE
jgi:hypothetical protein